MELPDENIYNLGYEIDRWEELHEFTNSMIGPPRHRGSQLAWLCTIVYPKSSRDEWTKLPADQLKNIAHRTYKKARNTREHPLSVIVECALRMTRPTVRTGATSIGQLCYAVTNQDRLPYSIDHGTHKGQLELFPSTSDETELITLRDARNEELSELYGVKFVPYKVRHGPPLW